MTLSVRLRECNNELIQHSRWANSSLNERMFQRVWSLNSTLYRMLLDNLTPSMGYMHREKSLCHYANGITVKRWSAPPVVEIGKIVEWLNGNIVQVILLAISRVLRRPLLITKHPACGMHMDVIMPLRDRYDTVKRWSAPPVVEIEKIVKWHDGNCASDIIGHLESFEETTFVLI